MAHGQLYGTGVIGSRRGIRNITMHNRTQYTQEFRRPIGKVETLTHQDARAGLSSTGITSTGQRILSELSTVELSIVHLLLEEGNNRAIAKRMETSVQVVKSHLHLIFQKVGVEDRLSLAISLIRNGVVECPCRRRGKLPLVEHRRETL
jgi:DNA-binding NarL/FixJ family response regulator